MDPRLDFSDLVEFSDVPDTISASRFGTEPLAPDAFAPDEDERAAPSPAPTRPDLTTRCLAKLIDVAVAAALYGLASAFFSNWFTAFLLGGIVASLYLLVSDGLDVDFMRRRSLGKRVMGLTVERIDGERMDLPTSVRRNWMFAVGFFAQAFTFVAPAVGGLLMLAALGLIGYEVYWVVTNPEGVRWGDDLAGTDVLQTVPVAPAAARPAVLHITPEDGF